MFQASLRLGGATALLWLWCALRGVPLFKRDGSLVAGVVAGALFAGEFACIYAGLVHTTSSRLTVFLYTSPFWVAMLLPLWVKAEKLRRVQWLGLLCAFGGVAFALREGWLAGPGVGAGSTALGDALGLLAGLLWALTTVVIRATRLSTLAPEKLLFYQLGVSALALPVLSVALGEVWVWQFSSFALTSLFLQTAVGAFASYLVWMWMLTRYPATQMSVFVFLTPVFALLFGSLWLKEAVTPGLLAGLAAVAAGIVLVNRRRST